MQDILAEDSKTLKEFCVDQQLDKINQSEDEEDAPKKLHKKEKIKSKKKKIKKKKKSNKIQKKKSKNPTKKKGIKRSKFDQWNQLNTLS